MLTDRDAQLLALRQQVTTIDTRLMALRQQTGAAHRRIKLCIDQLQDTLTSLPTTGDMAGVSSDIHEVILSLKHTNDFILGEPDHG